MAQWLRLGDSVTAISSVGYLPVANGKQSSIDIDASINLDHLDPMVSFEGQRYFRDGECCGCKSWYHQGRSFDSAACACRRGHSIVETEDIAVARPVDIMLNEGLATCALSGFDKYVDTCHQSSDFYFDHRLDTAPVQRMPSSDKVSHKHPLDATETAHSSEAHVPLTTANLHIFTKQSFEQEVFPSSLKCSPPWAAHPGARERDDDAECHSLHSSFDIVNAGGGIDRELWDWGAAPSLDSPPLSVQIEHDDMTCISKREDSEVASFLDIYTRAFVSSTSGRSRNSPSVSASVLLAGLRTTSAPHMATTDQANSYVKQPLWLVPDSTHETSREQLPPRCSCCCASMC
jgi:hypothetical protein